MANPDEEQMTELVKSLHVFAEGEVRWAQLMRKFNSHVAVTTAVDRTARVPKAVTQQSPTQCPKI